MKIVKVIIIVVLVVLVFKVGATVGVSKEEIQTYEDCIVDQYDMTSTQYYSLVGTVPICQ